MLQKTNHLSWKKKWTDCGQSLSWMYFSPLNDSYEFFIGSFRHGQRLGGATNLQQKGT